MMTRRDAALIVCGGLVAIAFAAPNVCISGGKAKGPVDPGVRGGPAGAGNPFSNLTADETIFFQDGFTRFAEVEVVAGGQTTGSGRASTRTNACLATHSRLQAERARPITP